MTNPPGTGQAGSGQLPQIGALAARDRGVVTTEIGKADDLPVIGMTCHRDLFPVSAPAGPPDVSTLGNRTCRSSAPKDPSGYDEGPLTLGAASPEVEHGHLGSGA